MKGECIICAEETNTIVCSYNHNTCTSCLIKHKMYKCEGCRQLFY